MIILASTSDQLQLVTSAAGSIDAHASWMDNAAGAITVGRTNTAITTATTTSVAGSPASGVFRNVKTLHVRNKGSGPCDVIVRHTDGTTIVELFKQTMQIGDQLQYTDEVGFVSIPSSPSGLVLLNTLTMAQQVGGYLPDTTSFTNTYDSYEFELVNLVPATNLAMCLMQVSIGAAWVTSAVYFASASGSFGQGFGASAAFGADMANNAAAFYLSGSPTNLGAVTNNASYGLSGVARLHGARGGAYKYLSGHVTYNAGAAVGIVAALLGGIMPNASAIDGVRFFFSTGNISSGLVRVYGRKTS